jgi:hypothetical protein
MSLDSYIMVVGPVNYCDQYYYRFSCSSCKSPHTLLMSPSRTEGRAPFEYKGCNLENVIKTFGQLAKRVMPEYPNCPVDQIDRVFKESMDWLHNPYSHPQAQLKQAERFVLAHRLVKSYNYFIISVLHDNLQKAREVLLELQSQNSNGDDDKQLVGLTTKALLLISTLRDIREMMDDYLDNTSQNTFYSRVKEISEKFNKFCHSRANSQELEPMCKELAQSLEGFQPKTQTMQESSCVLL